MISFIIHHVKIFFNDIWILFHQDCEGLVQKLSNIELLVGFLLSYLAL